MCGTPARKYIQNAVQQPEGRDLDVCGENIKTDFEEINCENVDFVLIS